METPSASATNGGGGGGAATQTESGQATTTQSSGPQGYGEILAAINHALDARLAPLEARLSAIGEKTQPEKPVEAPQAQAQTEGVDKLTLGKLQAMEAELSRLREENAKTAEAAAAQKAELAGRERKMRFEAQANALRTAMTGVVSADVFARDYLSRSEYDESTGGFVYRDESGVPLLVYSENGKPLSKARPMTAAEVAEYHKAKHPDTVLLSARGGAGSGTATGAGGATGETPEAKQERELREAYEQARQFPTFRSKTFEQFKAALATANVRH